MTYAGSAEGAPATLIFKTSHPSRVAEGWNAGRHEAAFYAQVASVTSHRHVPRCFGAEVDEETRTWFLLLEDLTETHATPGEWPLPPPLATCGQIIDAHADHQALHWDAPHLAGLWDTWRWRDETATHAYLEKVAAQIASFADRLGDRLPPERRDHYARLLEAAPRLMRRYRDRRHLTIVQGDAHVWNCFLPNDGSGDARLFDWDSWRIDLGASDLAYMLAVHWYPDRRRRHEGALLDRYHARLTVGGVRDYDRRALHEDYRLAALWLTTWPVAQCAYGIPPVIWWNNFERIMLAVDDLGCSALL